jgi:hypothetical protein
MGKDFSRKLFPRAKLALAVMFPLIVAACSDSLVWIRTDGQQLNGNSGLTRLRELDAMACRGDTPSKTDADSVFPDPPRQSDDDGFKACMVAHGYMRVPASRAASK